MMSEQKRKFENGDVVALNSGGPRLTVVDNTGGGNGFSTILDVTVSWVDDDGLLQEWTLPEVCFTKVEE